MRLGVFGGTFDPPHIGHLIVAQDAWAALGLDRVLFVPAAEPPHKRGRVRAPAALRLAMVEAACAGDARFEASDLEIRRGGTSYTVDTLRALKERDPEGALFFLLGADQFRDIHTWRSPLELARLAELVVLSRPGWPDVEPGIELPYRRLDVTCVDVSATEIRRRVAAGEPIRYLVPAGVEAIIRAHGLYGAQAGASGSR
ncbi:MAG TPA: nicotinate-nucleotide adenylyltransferase [Longimicrobiales bacterium]